MLLAAMYDTEEQEQPATINQGSWQQQQVKTVMQGDGNNVMEQ